MRPRVSGRSGTWSDTTSACSRSSPEVAARLDAEPAQAPPGPRTASSRARACRTAARSGAAVASPIRPQPTIPRVWPRRSVEPEPVLRLERARPHRASAARSLAGEREHERDRVLGDGPGVVDRRVAGDDAARRGVRHVHGVVTDPVDHDEPERGARRRSPPRSVRRCGSRRLGRPDLGGHRRHVGRRGLADRQPGRAEPLDPGDVDRLDEEDVRITLQEAGRRACSASPARRASRRRSRSPPPSTARTRAA